MQILLAQSQEAHSENGETQRQTSVGLVFSHFDIVNDVGFFYQRCGGLLNIQNELSYVASVMNSLHCLFHLRTTDTNYFQALKRQGQSLIRSTRFLDIR